MRRGIRLRPVTCTPIVWNGHSSRLICISDLKVVDPQFHQFHYKRFELSPPYPC